MEMEEAKVDTKSTPHESSVKEEEEGGKGKAGRRRRQQQRELLSALLSELETLEELEGDINDGEESNQEAKQVEDKLSDIEKTTKTQKDDDDDVGNCCSNEEIMNELKNVKRQNSITHCLVAAMIVLTLTWQLSEVSLILKIKDGLTNPLKSIGGIFGGLLKGRRQVEDMMRNASERQQQQKQVGVMEPTCLPGLKIPNLGLPGFDTSEDEKDD